MRVVFGVWVWWLLHVANRSRHLNALVNPTVKTGLKYRFENHLCNRNIPIHLWFGGSGVWFLFFFWLEVAGGSSSKSGSDIVARG